VGNELNLKIRPGQRHVTTTLARYNIPGLSFHLYDTWGMEETSYTGNLLARILQGKIPMGWVMKSVFAGREQELEEADETREDRRTHAVILFLPPPALKEGGEHVLDKLRVEIEHVYELDLDPVVLLGLADYSVDGLRDRPMDEHPEVQDLIKKASAALGVNTGRILPCVNYCDERNRVFDIDRLAYKIMELALRSADAFAINEPPELLFKPHKSPKLPPFEPGRSLVGPPSGRSPFDVDPPVRVRSPSVRSPGDRRFPLEAQPPGPMLLRRVFCHTQSCMEEGSARIAHADFTSHQGYCFQCASMQQNQGWPCYCGSKAKIVGVYRA
jgi:hypothetical protein